MDITEFKSLPLTIPLCDSNIKLVLLCEDI